MKTERRSFIESLINEEVKKLMSEALSFGRKAPGSAGQAGDDDDELDTYDILGLDDDSRDDPDFSDMSDGVGIGKKGNAYQAASASLPQQLDRARKGLPFADPSDEKN